MWYDVHVCMWVGRVYVRGGVSVWGECVGGGEGVELSCCVWMWGRGRDGRRTRVVVVSFEAHAVCVVGVGAVGGRPVVVLAYSSTF